MALFESIVQRLQIPTAFLTRHSPAVRTKFLEAAHKLDKEEERDAGLSQCLHVANSVVLRNPEHLDEALADIDRVLQGKDANTVLTIAALYFLLQYEKQKLKEQKGEDWRSFRHVQQEFDAKKWFIGEDAMRALGIEALP